MKLSVTLREDLPRLKRWASLDPDHRDRNVPKWWLTGTGYLSFRLDDDLGPVMYVKFEEPDAALSAGYLTLHVQFPPVEEVSRRRIAEGILKTFPKVCDYIREKSGYHQLVFKSTSRSLIRFMRLMKFESLGDDTFARAL